MSLLNVPNEIILIITESLGPKDVSSLSQTNSYLHSLLASRLSHLMLQEKNDVLHWAVRKNRLRTVQFLLDNGACAESRKEFGRTPLHYAAMGGFESIVDLLLENGADPNNRDNHNRRPFDWAALGGHTAIVRTFLQHGATLFQGNFVENSPLHWAAMGGHEPTIRLLLLQIDDDQIDHEDSRGMTVLHWLVVSGKESLVKLVIEKGANIYHRDTLRNQALHFAANPKFTFEWCFEGYCLDIDDFGNSPELRAYLTKPPKHEATIELLLEKGAEVDARACRDKTPLHMAAFCGYETAVQLLLENGADHSSQDRDYHQTPLHVAAASGYETIVKLLIEAGADIEAMSAKGTPITFAVENGHNSIVALLLANVGNSVLSKGGTGEVSLELAARRGNREIVSLLLDRGVNILAVGKTGAMAIHIAAMRGHNAVVCLLLERGVNIDSKTEAGHTSLHIAAQTGENRAAELLIEKGANISVQDAEGLTPLHTVVKPLLSTDRDTHSTDRDTHGQELIARQLVERGAEIMAVDKYGRTPLHLAAAADRKSIIELLLENGANIAARDNNGWTAFHWAAMSRQQAVVKILLGRGADINCLIPGGKTILLEMAYLARRKQTTSYSPWQEDWENYQERMWDTKQMEALRWAEMIRLLLENGIDAAAEDDSGKTALCVALSNKWTLMVTMLKQWPERDDRFVGMSWKSEDEYIL